MKTPEYFFVSDSGALYDTRRANWAANPLRPDYARHHSTITSGADMRASLRAGKYAWPGGYEVFSICWNGGVLCFDCIRAELYQVTSSIRHKDKDGWQVTDLECAADYDWLVMCDHCGRVIVEDWEQEARNGGF